jgi:hypothetical protein
MKVFWKFFGFAVLAAVFVAGIIGLITHSVSTAYQIIRQVLIVALAICGTIGLLVPIVLYFEDRKRKEDGCVVE